MQTLKEGREVEQWEEIYADFLYDCHTGTDLLFPPSLSPPLPALSELNIPSGPVHPQTVVIFLKFDSPPQIFDCVPSIAKIPVDTGARPIRGISFVFRQNYSRGPPSIPRYERGNRLYRFSPPLLLLLLLSRLSPLGHFSKKRIRLHRFHLDVPSTLGSGKR